MRLTDIMSNAGLSRYAEIALILFILAFIGIVVHVFAPSRKAEWDRDARLPLDEADPTSNAGAHR